MTRCSACRAYVPYHYSDCPLEGVLRITEPMPRSVPPGRPRKPERRKQGAEHVAPAKRQGRGKNG